MERIPLPDHVVAAQQKIQVLPNGEFARDRLLVVRQQELVPVVVADPIVREFAVKQMARQAIQDAANAKVAGIFLACTLIPIVIIPAIVYFGCVFF